MMLWLVVGETESQRWTIAAYNQEAPAASHAELAARHAEHWGFHVDHECFVSMEPDENPWDPRMLEADSGVRYYVESCTLATILP